MRSLIALILLCLCQNVSNPAQGGATASGSGSGWPVTVPGGATVNASLEQQSGWSGDSTASVSGAYAPAICSITPVGNGNPCPGAGTTIGGTYSGGGGGSTMTLGSQGVSGEYSGWMAKKTVSTVSGQLHYLIRATYNFSAVSSIQAWEIGRRATNNAGVTDNGQTQLVPISGSLLEFDIVPSSSGGWADTGCRFSTFTASTAYTEEIYYTADSSGDLSVQYVSLNGTLCTIPGTMQNVGGASLGWTPNEMVAAFQPDIKPGTGSYNALVTMYTATW